MKIRWAVVAVHSSGSLIAQGAAGETEIRDVRGLRCVETETRYVIDGVGMIPADAYMRGLRMVALKAVDRPFDLEEGMTLVEVD